MGVELFEYLWHGLLDYAFDIDSIDVLVIDDMEEVVELVGGGVDDVEPVASEAVGKEGSDDYACDDTQGHDEW